jgi:uracil-DNA glycosylase family 4
VICTLGNFATKLLTRSNRGISQVHGKPQETEIAGRSLRLYPLFHPAAALRTPATKQALREDFARLPELLAQEEPETATDPEGEPVAASQLDLFGG